MTTTAHGTIDKTTAAHGRLSSVASRVLEFVWPMYLTLVFTLAAWVLVPTVLLGWQPMAITSGSMAPTIRPGHVVVVDPYTGQDLGPGTVVTYRDPGQDRLVTHRIAAVEGDGTIRTRGDANAVDDPAPLTADRIVGVGRLVVPAAGLPALWAHEGRTELLATVAVLTLLAAGSAVSAASESVRSLRRRLPIRRGIPWRAPARTLGLAAGVVVVVALLGATAVSRAAFVGSGENPANAFHAGTIGQPTDLIANTSCVILAGGLTGPQVALQWTAAASASAYEIERSTAEGSGFTVVGTTSTTAYTDTTDLEHSTTYHYRVRPLAGPWSGPESATLSVRTPPARCLRPDRPPR